VTVSTAGKGWLRRGERHDCRRQWQAPGAATQGHFEKLLEEACPNHAYPIKHKLKDYYMLKNFMASGTLTRGIELDEVQDGGDAMPFPREDAVMTIYDGHPPLGGAPCV
jgi:hypothetical protein